MLPVLMGPGVAAVLPNEYSSWADSNDYCNTANRSYSASVSVLLLVTG
jgi:hypothetical protein